VFKSSSRPLPKDFQVVLDDVVIQPVNEVKLLGVHLDRHLTMAKHIDTTVAKCHGLLGVLRRASKVLPRDLLKLAYCSLIRSQLEYCSAVFSTAAPTHLSKLDTIQKIASRIITNSHPRAHSAPLLDLLDLGPLHTRRTNHIVSLVENILEGRSHPHFIGYFDSVDTDVAALRLSARTASRRFISFGKIMYDTFLSPNAIITRDLQSMLTGRPLTLSVPVHSAQAQTFFTNLQAIPVSALATSRSSSSQLDAHATDALVDDGE